MKILSPNHFGRLKVTNFNYLIVTEVNAIYILVVHNIDDLKVEFLWKRERLFDKNACEAILDICKENPTATIEQVESKPKNKWRPLPLDTVVSVV